MGVGARDWRKQSRHSLPRIHCAPHPSPPIRTQACRGRVGDVGGTQQPRYPLRQATHRTHVEFLAQVRQARDFDGLGVSAGARGRGQRRRRAGRLGWRARRRRRTGRRAGRRWQRRLVAGGGAYQALRAPHYGGSVHPQAVSKDVAVLSSGEVVAAWVSPGCGGKGRWLGAGGGGPCISHLHRCTHGGSVLAPAWAPNSPPQRSTCTTHTSAPSRRWAPASGPWRLTSIEGTARRRCSTRPRSHSCIPRKAWRRGAGARTSQRQRVLHTGEHRASSCSCMPRTSSVWAQRRLAAVAGT